MTIDMREMRGANETSGEIMTGKKQGMTRMNGAIGEGKAIEMNGEIGMKMSYNNGMLRKTEEKRAASPRH